ncbi:hypothetical protein Ctha_1592 [Chloroherpeton thalassium ATCC 35110]|uniref:Uncharacterized protein n=1 Tax=Chloroherpeton thalassium (strain ATCC 35110 / GB-78) TaxID=517418 RepID=B3QSK3_CHLT3|nr:hypothetical protein [Chloroherpeton thalassium]ACF14050.1 hypothetical protein Ctha_1592 [Chloroherpeton thalassium ATCC 35110]
MVKKRYVDFDLPPEHAPQYSLFDEIYYRASFIGKGLSPFMTYVGINQSMIVPVKIIGYVIVLFYLTLIGWGIYTMLRRHTFSEQGLTMLASGILMLLLPLYTSGIVYPGVRLVSLLAISGTAFFFMENNCDTCKRLAASAFLVVALSSYGYHAFLVHSADGKTLGTFLEDTESNFQTGWVYPRSFRKLDLDAALQGTITLPTFETGLIRPKKHAGN